MERYSNLKQADTGGLFMRYSDMVKTLEEEYNFYHFE